MTVTQDPGLAEPPARSAEATPSPLPLPAPAAHRIVLLNAGGYEGGGIGRIMLYMVRDWRLGSDSSTFTMIDTRGNGRAWQMPLYFPLALLRLLAMRLAGAVDLVHINAAGRGSMLRKVQFSLLAELLRLPTVLHLHEPDLAGDMAERGPLMRWLADRMFLHARRIVVLGEGDRTLVLRLFPVRPEAVVVVHNAVPEPAEATPGAVPASPEQPPALLFLGDLSDRKGVPELLKALARPELRRRPWHLTLAGGGPLDRFKGEVAAAGLGDRITFTGWVTPEKVQALLRSADLFALPSHGEGQAMSLLEAMAHGLAIVATPVGSHLEVVKDEESALLVTPGDVDQLARRLLRLTDDRPLRERLGAAARARYEAGFSTRSYVRRMAGIYGEVVAEAVG